MKKYGERNNGEIYEERNVNEANVVAWRKGESISEEILNINVAVINESCQ